MVRDCGSCSFRVRQHLSVLWCVSDAQRLHWHWRDPLLRHQRGSSAVLLCWRQPRHLARSTRSPVLFCLFTFVCLSACRTTAAATCSPRAPTCPEASPVVSRCRVPPVFAYSFCVSLSTGSCPAGFAGTGSTNCVDINEVWIVCVCVCFRQMDT